MAERLFGHVPGYPEGSLFENRAELKASRVHVQLQAGIAGSQTEGAESIVLSGGYEDVDYGDEIIYTGHGGRDRRTGQQVHDQPFAYGNRALALNCLNGLPVRVIRGSAHDSQYSPRSGYSYDGLYAVERYWHEPGRSGFEVWRFRLVKLPDLSTPGKQTIVEDPASYSVPRRREVRGLQIARDVTQAREIKVLYANRCQMCETRLECPAGPYSEAAHIRPLGFPHSGPDTRDNMLCLCPNHHVLFDNGAISIAEDLSLIGLEGSVKVHRGHHLDRRHLAYHREHLFVTLDARSS